MPLIIDIVVEADGWRSVGSIETLTQAAVDACLAEVGLDMAEGNELSLLLCDDARIRNLNRDFRGLEKPTNVLSFPAAQIPPQPVLGDIAIAYETVAREAAEEGKTLSDHYAHMVTHGLLHILGYDHEVDEDAEEMEALERRVLKRLRIADPYSSGNGDIQPT
jgi:probable rRNA maturation factor